MIRVYIVGGGVKNFIFIKIWGCCLGVFIMGVVYIDVVYGSVILVIC